MGKGPAQTGPDKRQGQWPRRTWGVVEAGADRSAQECTREKKTVTVSLNQNSRWADGNVLSLVMEKRKETFVGVGDNSQEV